ncbi:MAG: hypothetical protein JXR97_17225 [Planctomycetes bacterium]|nr:hypothetical protein [Planctomycetota bacterium]
MNENEAMLELVSYYKGELESEKKALVEEQLEKSAACRKELEAIGRTFDALHKELVPIELSAHFRMALADRLDEATQPAQTKGGIEIIRSSERHLRDMKKPAVIRMVEHAKRSPYFAASLLLHAAAVTLLVGFYFHMRSTQPQQPGSNNQLVVSNEISMIPEDAATKRKMDRFNAYSFRSRVPGFTTKAEYAPGGIVVNVAQTMKEDGNIVLDVNSGLSCVVAILTDGEGQPATESILKEFPNAVAARIQNSRIKIPSTVAMDYMDATSNLHVFDLGSQIEIWNEPKWTELKSEFEKMTASHASSSYALCTPERFAILPRREEEA